MSEPTAGRELDTQIAEKVTGWVQIKHDLSDVSPQDWSQYLLPHYSMDIAAAWEVVQTLIQQGYTLRLTGPKTPDVTGYLIEEGWSAAFVEPQYAFTNVGQSQGKATTPSLAICRAALEIISRREKACES